jgi:hypothetical protein
MRTFVGGMQVKSGHYIEGRTFEWVAIARQGDALPGGPQARWVRIPTAVVMAAAPALGGLLVLGLPFISVAVTVYALARAVGGHAKANAEKAAALLVPGAAVGEAHLTGKPGAADASRLAEHEVDERLDRLEAELEKLRRDGGR